MKFLVKCAGQFIVEYAYSDRARHVGEKPTQKGTMRARRISATVNPLKAASFENYDFAADLARDLDLTYPGQCSVVSMKLERVA